MSDDGLSSRRTLKLTLAYDGTAYAGWQVQPDQTTVQETLEKAIAKVTGEQLRVLASGRTDAGVHALGQVVGFRTECRLSPEKLLRALNANLPPDVAVLNVAEAPDDFHAISHVRRKRYRYVIHDGSIRDVFQRHFVWHYVHGRLDAEAMQRAASALVGTHDFRSFETAGAPRETSVRTVYELRVERGKAPRLRSWGDEEPGIGDWELDDVILIEIEADGFLYNMVRAIVGTLVQVGRGAKPENWPGEVLAAGDRRAAGPTAPPQGLCMVNVQYE